MRHEYRDMIGQSIEVGDTVVYSCLHHGLGLATVTALGEQTDHRMHGDKSPSLDLLTQHGSVSFAWARDIITLRRIA